MKPGTDHVFDGIMGETVVCPRFSKKLEMS